MKASKLKNLFILAFAIFSVHKNMVAQQAGDLDTTFGIGGKVNTLIQPVGLWGQSPTLLQPDGKIVISMQIHTPPNIAQMVTARYLPNGSLDPTWGQNGLITTSFGNSTLILTRDIRLQSNGAIIIGGMRDTMGSPNAIYLNPYLLKYNSDGTPDTSFGTQGLLTIFEPAHVYFNQFSIAGNRILGFGYVVPDSLRIWALDLDNGSIDSSWGTNGQQYHQMPQPPTMQMLTVLPDLKMLLLTNYSTHCFLPNGQLDSTFGVNQQGYVENIEVEGRHGLPGAVSILIQESQKFLTGGSTRSNSQFFGKSAIERYHINGYLDSSFANNGICIVDYGAGHSILTSLAVQQDGKIIAGGHLKDSSNNHFYFAMARYDSTGQVDTTFGNNGVVITEFHPSDSIELSYQALIQSDGKIVLAGHSALYSQSINGQPLNSFNLARYHAEDVLITHAAASPSPSPTTHFDFYPNPSKATISTTLSLDKDGQTTLAIYDIQGRMVQQLLNKKMPAGRYQETFTLSSELAAGVYVLKLQTENTQYARMLVIN